MKRLTPTILLASVFAFAVGIHAAESVATRATAKSSSSPAKVAVYKTPTCGCCSAWVEHLRRHGFEVVTHDLDNLGPIKQRVGVPYGMGSCHTAEVNGYFIEGHVPAAEVKRLLAQRPKARGLTVPGMPIGSPGMESGDRVEPYKVHLVHEDGTTSVYATYPQHD
ncbi:MAG: DUF411 domain-containing protein [Gammaproteobacteria bacterium]|nr:hypothetical protein [Gammaproteobacteria bacterium]